MNVPPWAGFVADFPDDQVETAGDIEVFGGLNVALALGEVFASLGCTSVSKPWSVAEVGWEFDFKYGPRNRFSCRVQSFHPVFWLLFEDQSFSNGEAYVELWRKFGNALERDPRFRKIIWRSFNKGPPDWDEVEAVDEPSARSFDEEFLPTTIKAKASRPSIWPYVIGIWLTLDGIALPLYASGFEDMWRQIRYDIAGVFFLVVGLFFLFIAINQGRETPWPLRQKKRY
jgi:hypothetical protein